MNYLILGKQVFGNNLSGTEFTEKLVISSDKEFTDEQLVKAFERHLVYQYTKEGWEEEEFSTWTEEDHFDVYDENGNANHVDYILKTSDTIPDFEEIDIDDYYDN
jgi:hypothetical protein|tara:strand:+ start:460 stop:774 length:315 start_codon:yes stop_codon:yes gene_type:complete